MLKEHATIFRGLTMFIDMSIVALSFFLGYIICSHQDAALFPFREYIWTLPLLLLIWSRLLLYFGMYESFRTKREDEIVWTVFRAGSIGFLIFSSFVYVFQVQDINSRFVGIIFTLTIIFLCIEKMGLFILLKFFRSRGFNTRSVLVVGTSDQTSVFIQMLREHEEWGLRVLGLVERDNTRKGQLLDGCPVLGTFEDIPAIIESMVVDEVVFAVKREYMQEIEEIIHYLEIQGKRVSVAVNFFKTVFTKYKINDLGGFPLVTFESTPDKAWHLVFKRMIDVAGALAGLIISAPMFAVVAILIKLDSEGPVFFVQKRVGLNGRIFRMFKFRTMIKGAERRQNELRAYNEMQGPVFKLQSDPRVTRLGRWLRKTSIDELPQLWNVLKGDMSLVGPRPPIPSEVKQYQLWQKRRLSMRPGITCLWQVNGRNRITDFNQWMSLDLQYIDNWSLARDIKILFKTIPTVLFGIGAK